MQKLKSWLGLENFSWKRFFLLHLGVLVAAVGVAFFKYPNHFAMGGVSGLSVVAAALIPGISPGTFAMITNIILIIIAMFILGKGLAFTTAYASILLSGLLVVIEKIYPLDAPLTDEPLLELFFAVGLSALGAAILFNMQTSTGGTDIIALIIRKYIPLDIGHALLLSDVLIAVSTLFIFDLKTGFLSLTGLLLKGVIVDNLIESFNRVKYFTIVTSEAEEVGDWITANLKRGATKMRGKGVYSGQDRAVFLVVVKRFEAVQLRDAVRKIDPTSFIMITNTSEIIGRGFTTAF
ncbi:MAG: YitT family protein [Eubacteriales bacterium]|nr:YitT family protein [Eubacteriales bacterium]